jgi:hypothetical protein
MGPISAWAALLVGCLAYCATMVLHAFLFGKRTGNIERDVETNRQDVAELKIVVARIRSALEGTTGVSIEGFDFRRRGDD